MFSRLSLHDDCALPFIIAFRYHSLFSQAKWIVHLCWYSLLINLSNSIIYMIPFQFVSCLISTEINQFYKCFSSARSRENVSAIFCWYWIFSKIITMKLIYLFILLHRFFAVLYQKRYKRERRLRARLQQQMENELKKRSQIEEILKASGAPAEALRILAGNYNDSIPINKIICSRPKSMVIWNLMRCWATFTVILTNFSCFWHLKWFCPAVL